MPLHGKKVVKLIKLQPGGSRDSCAASRHRLGPCGRKTSENSVNQSNTKTKAMAGSIIPVLMKVYSDRSFDFIVKKPPASRLILKATGLEKGSDL